MSSAALKIKIFDSKGTQLLPIAKSTATVGSANHCDVVLSHSSVQSEHVRAWCEGGRIWVQDLGTQAGTTLNGVRLPPLKPMLVREMDILKLGECSSTMGLEPNLIRAPVVRPQPVQEVTKTDIIPLKREDNSSETTGANEQISRELADLKLQLQMARLDKNSGDELRKELNGAREELARLTAENQRLKESFRHVDGDKKNFKKQMENEVADLKLRALRDLKEQREEDAKRFEHWKSEALTRLTSGIRSLSDLRVKTWATRPLSKDMIFEWEGDLNALFRKVMVVEHQIAPPPTPTSKLTQPNFTVVADDDSTNPRILAPDDATVIMPMRSSLSLPAETVVTSAHRASTSTNVHAATSTSVKVRSKKKSRRPTPEGPWQRIAIGAFVVALIMAVAWFASSHLKQEGARSMASQIETAPPPVKGTTSMPPYGAPLAKPAPKPAPLTQTPEFKKTYTDNVLYTTGYIDSELNMDFRADWLKNLSRTATREWKLSEKTIAGIAGKEILFLQDLKRFRAQMVRDPQPQIMTKMRERETVYLRDLQALLGSKVSVDKFMRHKRAFFARNPVYPAREKR